MYICQSIDNISGLGSFPITPVAACLASIKMNFPGVPGGGEGGATNGMSDQEAAMVKAVRAIHRKSEAKLTDFPLRCKQQWKHAHLKLSFLVAWALRLEGLLACSCRA